MNVPFLDLKAQYRAIKAEIDAAISNVLDSCAFSGGPFVEKLEKAFAEYCGCEYAVGVGSGTDAIWMALIAKGVARGDEIITVPNSFLATAEAITLTGATPVLVDVKSDTYTMDPALIEAVITPRTRGIIPVHLFGQTADMDPIMEIARRHGLFVIEDACQAHGATYKGMIAGSIGDAGCYSFYPGKNLGAYGEAGAVVTNDAKTYEKMRMFRDHGQRRKYVHEFPGCNARMDGLQAAILSVKLEHLDEWNAARHKAAQQYREMLHNVEELILPAEAPYGTHVYHVFAVRIQGRDEVNQELLSRGIHCGIHYPIPIHLQEAYRGLGLPPGSFTTTEQCAAEFLSLPMFPEITAEQCEYVAENLRQLAPARALAL